MSNDSLNKELLDAVTYFRVSEVKRLLEQGADPNYSVFAKDWTEDREDQPWSPLRMVMFRISDCDLPEKGLMDFKEVARLLIAHGADTKPAMELAERRYGKYNAAGERNSFLQVWDVVAIADTHSGA